MCVFLPFVMGRLSLLTYDCEINNLNDAIGNFGLLFCYYLLPSFFFLFLFFARNKSPDVLVVGSQLCSQRAAIKTVGEVVLELKVGRAF